MLKKASSMHPKFPNDVSFKNIGHPVNQIQEVDESNHQESVEVNGVNHSEQKNTDHTEIQINENTVDKTTDCD